MKKFIIWFLLIFLVLYLIVAVITTPVSWIGLLLTLFGLYQVRQQKKGKLTFSKPGRIVGAGIALTFILVVLFAEPAEKTDVTEKEAKVTNEAESKKQIEGKEAKEEAEKIAAEQKVKEETAARLGLVMATISKVIDGDTVELSDGRKVRLIGVNTPESTTRHEEYGKEASNYTKSKLEGKKVWLQKDISETDRYGRLLRIVWLQIPNNDMDESEIRTKMFNADLVLNGYAEPYTYPPDVKYSDYFVKFAREAREQNKGLWAFGEYGTTKGDLDPKQSNNTASSGTNNNSSNGSNNSSNSSSSGNTHSSNNNLTNSSTPASNGGTEYFANCTELRKVYPNGVPSNHPAYQPKMDRDKDGYACER